MLTERVEHLGLLASLLKGKVQNVFTLRGGMEKKQRTAAMNDLKSLASGEPCVILATGRYAGEGFDLPRLDTLFLVMPISWRGTLQQYVGRLHRQHAGKRDVRVYDYVDLGVPMLQRMLSRRMRGYRALGYTTGDQLTLPGVTVRTIVRQSNASPCAALTFEERLGLLVDREMAERDNARLASRLKPELPVAKLAARVYGMEYEVVLPENLYHFGCKHLQTCF